MLIRGPRYDRTCRIITTQLQCARSLSSSASPTPIPLRPLSRQEQLEYLRQKAKDGKNFRKARLAQAETQEVPLEEQLAAPGKSILGSDRRPWEHEWAYGIKAPSPPLPRDVVMTERELMAFNSLFGQVLNVSRAEQHRLMEESIDKDDLYDSGYESNEIVVPSEKEVEMFPKPLRAIAKRALEQTARKNYSERLLKDPVARKAENCATPIRDMMLAAKTDYEVWEIVERELFGRFRAFDADLAAANEEEIRLNNSKPVKTRPGSVKGKETLVPGALDAGTANKGRDMPLSVFSLVYQRSLLLAQRLLCRGTVYTPFAFALLPAIRKLGPNSFAMGVSPGLFNELVRYSWRIHNSIQPVLALLKEMDNVLCPMNVLTLDALQEITGHRKAAERGDFGTANADLEFTADRTDEGNQLWKWKARITNAFEQAELERVQRKEQEAALSEHEAALSE